jgi:hypothetical protein
MYRAGHGHPSILAGQAFRGARVQNDEGHEQVLHHRTQRSSSTHQNDRPRAVKVRQDVGQGRPTYRRYQSQIGDCLRILNLKKIFLLGFYISLPNFIVQNYHYRSLIF